MRLDALVAAGGFDTRLRTVSVEDVELGRTLYDRGERVLLDKELAAEHRHRFSLVGALRNDLALHHAKTTLQRRLRGDASAAMPPRRRRSRRHPASASGRARGAFVLFPSELPG